MLEKIPPNIDPENIKALAFDLDGTILRPDSVLSERTIGVLKALMARNIAVIITTGRSPQSSEPYRSAIGTEGPMVYYNGAEVILMPVLETLSLSLLEHEIVNYCVDLARSLEMYMHIFLPRKKGELWELLLAEGFEREAKLYSKRTGLHVSFDDLKTAMEDPSVKGCIKMMLIADEDKLKIVSDKLNVRFGDRVYMARSYPRFLEIINGRANKGNGLSLALNYLGISNKNVIAFGDADNDIPLFKAAGFSIAPANADTHVLQAVDMIVDSNLNDGVAAFLERLFSL